MFTYQSAVMVRVIYYKGFLLPINIFSDILFGQYCSVQGEDLGKIPQESCIPV